MTQEIPNQSFEINLWHTFSRFQLVLLREAKMCVFYLVSTSIWARFQVKEGVLGFLGNLLLKHLYLREFLELSEASIHFSNDSRRFLSISDEFLGEYLVNIG